MMDDPPKQHGRHRLKVENEMIRKREREFRHAQMWNSTQDYYKRWQEKNTKFDEWTSPRFYEENTKLVLEEKSKRDKQELLEKRREKLRQLLQEDDKSYEIELVVQKTKSSPRISPEVPTEVLKEVNIGLKMQEEEKRRREAELKLYQQWRINNPIVRQYESKYRFKDLKLSWLDQQIEKRMEREKEEEECKRILKERDEEILKQTQKEVVYQREVENKRKRLKDDLDKQMEELFTRQALSEELKKKEDQELNRKLQLSELHEQRNKEEKLQVAKECALYNIKQYKLKLKHRAADIEDNLTSERYFILKLQQLELEESIEDADKKLEVKEGLDQFLKLINEQRELEKHRQRHLQFLFDSEAKAIYEKQLEMWRKEELARKKLVQEVMKTLQKQIEENLEKNRQRQRDVLKEREEMMQKIEEYDRDMKLLQEEEQKRKLESKKVLEDDIKVKQARKKYQENMKLKEIDEELERVRREEERLQNEILDIQKRRPLSSRPRGRSSRFF